MFQMSIPNLTNNIIQSQNIVINQVPLTHALLSNVNANNGIPLAQTLVVSQAQQQQQQQQQQQNTDHNKTIMMDTMPIAGGSLSGTPSKNMHNNANNTNNSTDNLQVLSKTRMADLVREIDPNIYMDEDVEEILLSYMDEFVDRVLNGASMIAKHRHVNNIEVKDVQQFINRNFNMWAPGFGTDELRPYKRSLTTESHKQRLALIRKALKKY